MSRRICDKDGNEKELKGGKTCENGHFICKECLWQPAGFFSGPMKYCPICERPTPLR